MPRPTRNRLSHVISGLVGFTGALVLLAANTGSEPAETGAAAETLEAVNPLPTGDGAAADEPAVGIGPQWDVLNWGPGPRAVVPSAHGIDTVVDGRTEQKVFVSSQANDDVGAADSITNMSTSTDSAVSFLTTKRNAPVGALNMVRLGDGSLMSIEFIPEWADDAHTSVYLRSWYSTDQGETWELRKGLFTPPAGSELGPMNRGLRVHGGPMLLTDGTIVVPAYTAYKGRRASSIFLQSRDGGATWSQRSEIPAGVSTNEVGWSYTVDGDLIAVIRTAESPARLQVTFSDDDGLTWDTAKPLLDPNGVQVVGIYPNLVLQPNGVLMMSTGRPDTRVLIDYDGTGESWDENQLVYVRYPSETGNGRYDGTSGNTDLVNVDANRTVFIGDKCHVWGCKAYHEQYGVFASYVNAVTPGTGKIDVATKLITGTAAVSGTFAKSDKTFPEQRAEGAFDGSSQPWAAAVLQAQRGAPSMVVELDRVYSLNRIGLMLGTGQPLDATVSLSVDGTTWSEPVVTAAGTRDHALRYTDIPPQQARYVKVSTPARSTTPVTELELYATDVQTFENDPLYAVPRGFTDATNTTTINMEMKGADSSTSVRLFDKFLDDNAAATRPAPDVDHQLASFQFGTNDYRGPFVFGVTGHDGDEARTPWTFRLVPGTTAAPAQTLEVSDGSTWTALGTLTTPIALNTWVPITVDATTSQATVTVAGQEFSTTTKSGQADALAGVTFSTGDPIAYGMSFFLDDLSVVEGD